MYMDNPEDYLQTTGHLIKPSTPKINEKHSLEIEDKKLDLQIEEKRWRSCCFDLHQESSLFFAKITVSMAVITLCGYQLVTLKDCNYQSLVFLIRFVFVIHFSELV